MSSMILANTASGKRSAASLTVAPNFKLAWHDAHRTVNVCGVNGHKLQSAQSVRLVVSEDGVTKQDVRDGIDYCVNCLVQVVRGAAPNPVETGVAAHLTHATAATLNALDLSMRAAARLHVPSSPSTARMSGTHIIASGTSLETHHLQQRTTSGGSRKNWWTCTERLEQRYAQAGELLVLVPIGSTSTVADDAALAAAFEHAGTHIGPLVALHQPAVALFLPSTNCDGGAMVPSQSTASLVLTRAPSHWAPTPCAHGRHTGREVSGAAVVVAMDSTRRPNGTTVIHRAELHVPMVVCTVCGDATCLLYGGLETIATFVGPVIANSQAFDLLYLLRPSGDRAVPSLSQLDLPNVVSVPRVVSCAPNEHAEGSVVPLTIWLRATSTVYAFVAVDRKHVRVKKRNYIVVTSSRRSESYTHYERCDMAMSLLEGTLITYRFTCAHCSRLLEPCATELKFLRTLSSSDDAQQLASLRRDFAAVEWRF